jgi:hypothetical protein
MNYPILTMLNQKVNNVNAENTKKLIVKITYFDDKQTDYTVALPGGKRKLRYTMPHSQLDGTQFSLLTLAYEQTIQDVDRKILARMDSIKVYKLVERRATEFCYAYSPKANSGLDKRFIRHTILQALQEINGDGESQ